MASKPYFLEEELCCSVCCEIFRDPVVLGCSHSFCDICLQRCWEEKKSRECPICRRKSALAKPTVSLTLKNIVESYLKQKTESEAAEKAKVCCSLHGEKLLLFCEEDEEPLCVVCQTSKKHRNHQLCPVEEAALDVKKDLKAVLIPLKEKLERFTAVKQECEKTAEHFSSQAQHTERQIKAEFEKLHQFLRDEEGARLAALRMEAEQKSQIMNEKMINITRDVSTLTDKVSAIEKAMNTEDVNLLRTYKSIKRRAQCTLQDPEMISITLINVAKHLGNLKFKVWERMLEMVHYTPVTLDPNTAAPWLFLSDDLTNVRNTGLIQQVLDNPERFNPSVDVLGSEGFTSGSHSWDVLVGNKPEWTIGVVKESINRKGVITCDSVRGFWVVTLRNGDEYKASGTEPLTLKRKPQRIRVQLDYDRGKVSFCDPLDMSHIYTFNDEFMEKIFPYFSPSININGSNPGALQICPIIPSVSVSS